MTSEPKNRDTAARLALDGANLFAGNEHFERRWRIPRDGSLVPVSLRTFPENREWLVAPPLDETDAPPDNLRLIPLTSGSTVEAESVRAELRAADRTYEFQIFADSPGIRITARDAKGGNGDNSTEEHSGDAPTGVEVDPSATAETVAAPTFPILETLTLAPLHLRLTQVDFQDQTDIHNELVFEREWLLHTAEKPLPLSGCLFFLEDTLTGDGLILFKEAPLPHARPPSESATARDATVHPKDRRLTIDADSYAVSLVPYSGGAAGRIAAIQRFQRCLRPYVSGRDGLLLSNTWGDRNRDARVEAGFLALEIDAGARLGVDVIQIDDGWEVGATSNSVRAKDENGGVWEGYYAARGNFWDIHPGRFPDGLAPLVALAREKNLRFGLWFSPDSSDDFANFNRDADTILRLHRDLGIDFVKIDGVKVRTTLGERNLNAFFDRVLNESGGRVVFDLDVTAEIRPGYLGLVRVGPLFVENRYTDWRRYWPHQTLRNLWKLARHLDPARLRMEWLNHARHETLYEGDPLAPARFRPDYLFATVMLSSPLAWFEVSQLPQSYFTEASPLIATWKAHRDTIFSNTILPIGDAPDGVAWTGFLCHGPTAVYLLAFREASAKPVWRHEPPVDLPDTTFARLGGDGSARVTDGVLRVEIPESHRFFFGVTPVEDL